MDTAPWNSYEDDARRRNHRAATAPASSSGNIAHPRALIPGYNPNPIDSSYFQPPPPVPHYPAHMTRPSQPPPPPRPPFPLPSSEPHPSLFLQRSLSSPPPIPPRPPQLQPPTASSYQQLNHRPLNLDLSSGNASTEPDTPSPTEEADLAMALALSQSVSNEEQKLREKMVNQEEEDLARALEASMLDTEDLNHHEAYPDNTVASPSKLPLDLFTTPKSTSSSLSTDAIPLETDTSHDEAFAKILAAEQEEQEETLVAGEHKDNLETTLTSVDTVPEGLQSNSQSNNTVDDDKMPNLAFNDTDGTPDGETVLHHCAQEYDDNANCAAPTIPTTVELEETHPVTPLDLYTLQLPVDDTLAPDEKLANLPAEEAVPMSNRTSEDVIPLMMSSSRREAEFVDFEPPSYADTTISSSVSNLSHSMPASEDPSMTLQEVSQSLQGSDIRLPPQNTTSSTLVPRSERALSTPSSSMNRVPSTRPMSEPYETETHSDQSSNAGIVNLNYFVEKELFMGVSVGFTAPKMSSKLVPMPDLMPNIISLPYGRCPPLHLQGPSWKHLLKLMAKLSGTRLEPTLEAVAVSKISLKLRTVVQFVKPHHMSPDWRTILYFTVDYPSPQPNYGQSVNDLPFSYSLSSVPALLRDAVDTPVSKSFTVPATDLVPYPTLPITFPNLAMYLQAALEDSRRYLNDGSSGNRKLAKMIQTCYQSQEDTQAVAEYNGVGGLFKRVMGRGRKSVGPQRGGNEDTYELVTPFVQDEWG